MTTTFMINSELTITTSQGELPTGSEAFASHNELIALATAWPMETPGRRLEPLTWRKAGEKIHGPQDWRNANLECDPAPRAFRGTAGGAIRSDTAGRAAGRRSAGTSTRNRRARTAAGYS